MLLVNAGLGETRIALVANGRLSDYQVARDSEKTLLGNLYLGRVTRVMPAMQAAFVEIGTARAGFLALNEARNLSARSEPGISDCVREGEAVAVRVIREGEGDKGPRLTTKVTLTQEQEAARKMARPPALLAAAPSLLERMLLELPRDTARIAIDDARTAEAARAFCRVSCPGLEAKIETVRDVFDDALEEDIARLSASRVPLPGGGWITIEITEGFTAIDVNSGGYAASGGREETALAVNLEAAQEIARQIGLRGIGGLVVADFIQMEDMAATRLVESVLTEGLGNSVPTDVTLSRTGLAVITRKRVRPPLSRFLESCAHCDGTSLRPTAESVALSALRAAERNARAAPGRPVTLRAAPEVLDWIKGQGDGLARRGLAGLKLETGPGPREAFDVTTG